jgi:hypothetical protein
VKKSIVIVGMIGLISALGVFLWPVLMLELAKQAAIRKLAPQADWFSHVPSNTTTNIARAENSSQVSSLDLSGCIITLPYPEFKPSAKHQVFTNDDMSVAFFGAVDPKEFVPLEHQLDCSNVFDLISRSYHATVSGISNQRNTLDLQRYLGLLTFKATTAPAGSDHFWMPFDRGDFNGFISGDLAKDGRVAVEIYVKEKDQFLAALIKRKQRRGDISDISHILSILRISSNTSQPESPIETNRP